MNLRIAVCLLSTVMVLAIFSPGLANAQVPPIPVKVTNTSLPVQGTVNANITNPSVAVTGTVTVNNTPSAPLFTDADGAARKAVGASCDVDFTSPPSQVQCQLGTVPVGKTLVIETVTCRADTTIGEFIGPFLLSVGTPGLNGGAPLPFYYDLALTKTGTLAGAYDMYSLTTPIHVYAASGTGVYAIGGGDKPANARTGMACTISGHLVDE